jgi:proteic killer suppression protein
MVMWVRSGTYIMPQFKDKKTLTLYESGYHPRVGSDIQQRALARVRQLTLAVSLEELRSINSFRLEKLSGNRKGQYSIRVNDQWRLCFEWQGDKALNIELVDYH